MPFWTTLLAAFRRRDLEADMAEEMALHRELQTERNRRSGMSPEAARRAAQRQFGHLDSITEAARDARGWAWLEALRQDLRFGLRMLAKRPGYTAASSVTLALGIGLVATVVAVLNGTVFARLPFPDSDRIVAIGAPPQQFEELARRQTTVETLALAAQRPVNLEAGGFVTRQDAAVVSAHFLEVLQAKPVHGRALMPADELPGAEKAVLISETLWRDAFQSDPAVLEREIKLNGEPHAIVGVMAATFGFPRRASLWTAHPTGAAVPPGAQVFGRLAPGVSAAQAGAEFATLVAPPAPAHDPAPSTARVTVTVEPFAQQGVKDAIRVVLLAIFGATVLVLLLACANVTNLVLARTSERARELAVRRAVGASRARLIRQLLVESFLLAALGAVGGWCIASASTQLLWETIAPEAALTGGLPFWVNFNVDGRVLAVVVIAALAATLLIGLTPALQATRIDLAVGIKQGGGAGLQVSRFTRLLVNVQMALSVSLVVGAGLFLTILIAFNQKQLPYDPRSVLTAQLPLDDAQYGDPASRSAFLSEVMQQVAALPGVEAVAATSAKSLRPVPRPLEIEGHTYGSEQRPTVWSEAVSPAYFATLGVRVVDGRAFTANDHAASEPVAIVNTAFAERFGERNSLVGRRVRFSHERDSAWFTVVGIAPELGSMKAGRPSNGAVIYRPLAQEPAEAVTLLVRGTADVETMAPTLRRLVAKLDPTLPLSGIHSVQTIVELERIGINIPGTLFIVCGLGALLLAAVGVYGVISFSVKLRMREFGVRLALGATPSQVSRLVLTQGFRQIVIGLGAGVLLALGSSAAMTSTFAGLGQSAYNGWIYVAVVTVLGGVGVAALWIPAARASRADPMVALRVE